MNNLENHIPDDLHSPENIKTFAKLVDEYEKHERCGSLNEAVASLRKAIYHCPYPSLGGLLEARLNTYKISKPWNAWTALRSSFGRSDDSKLTIEKNGKMMRVGREELA